MARTKGSLLAVRLEYLDRCRSPEEKAAVFAALPESTARALEAPIEPDAWYPIRHLVDLHRAIGDELEGDSDELIFEVGRYAAAQALAEVSESLAAQGSPLFLFRQAPSIWHQHHDSGRIRAVDVTGSSGTFLIEGYDDPTPELCISVRGWIERAIELTGVRRLVVEERRCRCRGDERCEFLCSWSPKER